jgi:hypothetical protein
MKQQQMRAVKQNPDYSPLRTILLATSNSANLCKATCKMWAAVDLNLPSK